MQETTIVFVVLLSMSCHQNCYDACFLCLGYCMAIRMLEHPSLGSVSVSFWTLHRWASKILSLKIRLLPHPSTCPLYDHQFKEAILISCMFSRLAWTLIFFKSLTCMQWRPHTSTGSALRMSVVNICALCMCAYINRQNGFSTRMKYPTFCLFISILKHIYWKLSSFEIQFFFTISYVSPVRMNWFL